MQGSGVLFNPNGQKALEAISTDLLERYAVKRPKTELVSSAGVAPVNLALQHVSLCSN